MKVMILMISEIAGAIGSFPSEAALSFFPLEASGAAASNIDKV